MNTPDNNTKIAQQPSLPPLVKGSAIYKLFVPRKVEEKIRYLCRKFPTLEWSGILFTSYEGNFEDGSLVITCQDLYPMDLGTSTYTDFKMDETVAGYIAENIDLFGCDMSLIHSHNNFSCFFSGTDQSTLRSEGNDQNCFVSLIVNNAGKYCAAITRKVQTKLKVTTEDLGTSYEFFGEGSKTVQDEKGPIQQDYKDDTFIEYFDLEVQVEHVDNPLAYLDTRFDEIQENKKKAAAIANISSTTNKVLRTSSPWLPNPNPVPKIFSKEDFSSNGLKDHPKEVKQQTLFSENEMEEMVDTSNWEPDSTIIHKLVCQMITCSLIVSDNVDIKQWINKWMDKKYAEIFEPFGTQFEEWKEFIVEFMVNQYSLIDRNTPDIDFDLLQSKIAKAIHDELCQYDSTETYYIKEYIEVLTRYIYE